MSNLGITYDLSGQYQQALNLYRQALSIAHEIGNRTMELTTIGNLGITFHNLGRYQQAIYSFQQHLAMSDEIGDQIGKKNALGNLGMTYASLGQYQQAIDFFQQSLKLGQEIGFRAGEVRSLISLGVIYDDLGQFQQAINFLQQALKIAHELNYRHAEGSILLNLSATHLNLEQHQSSFSFVQQAIEIFREIGDRAGEGSAIGSWGNTYFALSQYEQAIELYQQELEINREVGNIANEGTTLNNLGVALFNNGNLSQAEDQLFAAINILETLRLGGLPEEQRISLVETQLSTFQNLQNVLIDQNKIKTALEVAERGRARIFLEELALRLNPEFTAQFDELPLPNIAQIQKIAKDQNATLVQYSIIQDKELFIWVIQSTGRVEFQRINLKDQSINLSDIVDIARSSMGVFRSVVDWGEQNDSPLITSTQLNRKLQQLHQILIVPIKEFLPHDPDQLVVFIPQDELFLVPFAALQDSEGNYLIDQHIILTTPSIQVLDSTRKQQAKVQQANLQENLVIGDPTMPPLSLVPGEPSISLDELPGAEQEAIDIATLLNTDPLLGDAATKSTIVQQMPNARIIHLATHGILDEFQGLNGGVVLSADGTGEFNDGLLTAAEIAQMELNAELVVLSACNTGQGRITGDGVVGLSRSLILAGVPSVVVSLWAVPDQPTGELMVEFYRQLEQTNNKAKALRQAMLIIREKYPEPIAWAGFTLIGEAE